MAGETRRRGLGGFHAQVLLEAIEDVAVAQLLGVPHVGVEEAVVLGDVGHEHEQFEDVAFDLELDAGEVLEDRSVAGPQGPGVLDGEVHRFEGDRRVFLAEAADVLVDLAGSDDRSWHMFRLGTLRPRHNVPGSPRRARSARQGVSPAAARITSNGTMRSAGME